MVFSTTSTPGGSSLGTQDLSRQTSSAETKSASMTMTLTPILAQRGRSKATIAFTAPDVRYGTKTFDKNSAYFMHSNKFVTKNAALGVPTLIKRVIPETATKAMLRYSVELIPTDLPLYSRNSDGSFKTQTDSTTGLTTSVQIGTIKGTRVILHVGVESYVGDAQLFKQGNIIDDFRDGSTTVSGKFLGEITRADGSKEYPKSRLLPIIDIPIDSEGEYGNNIGLRIGTPNYIQNTPANANNVIKNKAFPLRVTVMERDSAASTPAMVKMLSGDFTQDMFFKPKAVDYLSSKNISLGKKFISSYYQKETATSTEVWGPFGDIYVYDKNVNEIQQALAEGYTYTDSNGNDIAIKGERDYDVDAADYGRTTDYAYGSSANYGLLNFLSGKDLNNVPYFAFSVSDSLLFGGVVIDEATTHYATGGNDGLYYLADGTPADVLNLKLFDDAVRSYVTNFGAGEDTLKDILRYPMTNFIDTGYSMDTKLALSNILTARPDVFLIVGTKSVADNGIISNDIGPVYLGSSVDAVKAASADLLGTWDYQDQLSPDQDLALGVKLKTHFSLYPESTYFGTPIMRVMVFGNAGYDIDDEYPHQLPGSYDRGLAMNRFTQVLKWEAANDFTEDTNRKPRYLKDMVYYWREEPGYDTVWDAGMNFLRSFDTVDVFWPAVRTIYPYEDSILLSAKFAIAACKCHYIGMEVWRSISGENKTDNQFKQDLENEAVRLLTGIFTADVSVVPVAILDDADKARGYSGQLKFYLATGSMRTKLTYSVHGYTADQLAANQGLLAAA